MQDFYPSQQKLQLRYSELNGFVCTCEGFRVRGSLNITDEDAASIILRANYALDVLSERAVSLFHLPSINGIAKYYRATDY